MCIHAFLNMTTTTTTTPATDATPTREYPSTSKYHVKWLLFVLSHVNFIIVMRPLA